MQNVLTRSFSGTPFARDLERVDMEALLSEGRAQLAKRPRTRAELAPLFGKQFPWTGAARRPRLLVEPFERLPKREIDAVIAEGERLLGCAAGDADARRVELVSP